MQSIREVVENMLFKYKGMDQSGKNVKGTVTASSLDEAKQKLKSQGIFYSSIDETREFSLDGVSQRSMPIPLISGFSKELSSYLASGMTILTALKLMENQHEGEKKYISFLNSTRTMIDEGKALHQALSVQKVYKMPDFFLQSVKVAAKGGKMTEVLSNMSNFFSIQEKVTKRVKSAMTYPVVIFVFAMLISGFLITFVVPQIVGIFEDNGQELPDITKFILGISEFLQEYYLLLILGIIGLILVLKFIYRKSRRYKAGIDSMLMKTPIFGELIQNHELGRFSYIISLMLDSGVSYAQAVQLASTTFGNSALSDSFARASDKVMEGNKLSNALYISGGFRPKRNFMQSLALGEESSEVASVLHNLSALYAEENEDKLERLLGLLTPLMMILIGGIVGTIVVAMLMPILSMSSSLQG